MFNLRMLSPEERAEYDALLFDATHDELGEVLPTKEFGPRMRDALAAALAAGREWVQWLMDDDLESAFQRRAKVWLRESETVDVSGGESVIMRKSARMGVRRKIEATGESLFRQIRWEDLTVEDLWQILKSASARRASEAVTIATARRFLDLCEEQQAQSTRAALKASGQSLDDFLVTDEQATA